MGISGSPGGNVRVVIIDGKAIKETKVDSLNIRRELATPEEVKQYLGKDVENLRSLESVLKEAGDSAPPPLSVPEGDELPTPDEGEEPVVAPKKAKRKRKTGKRKKKVIFSPD